MDSDHSGREYPGETGEQRDRIADDRDWTSDLHEMAAEARDDKADARDEGAEARDDSVAGAKESAAFDRAESARDRSGAGRDRAHAAADREASWSDRLASARERAVSATDTLTAARSRDTGIVELQREILRAKRTAQPFVLAFVDLDDLKKTNDSLGHAAGDQRLRETVNAIRANLRSYDLIVRFGGDEFLCGLLDLTMDLAAKRFVLVNADLSEGGQAPVTVGLADLKADESLESLIARADDALYRQRQKRQSDAGL